MIPGIRENEGYIDNNIDNPNEDDDDFNHGLILPPLLVQLKKILEQYPDDSQILKELIQNAEDAGAKVVRFLYDRKQHGTNPRALHHPGLAKYQGPALYAYNDALFSDDDWRGVRMLSQSVKQHDRFKVGYFGMGFKSIFHLTDLPCILSGDRLGMIDPHQKVFPLSTHSWNIAKSTSLLRTHPDQFSPFINVFDATRDTFSTGYYKGTLFRFPLRAQASHLSDTLYTEDRVRRLFEAFSEDAHLVLLFLRHLECVELLERDEQGVRPRLVFRVQIAPSCLREVRRHRQDFLAHVANKGKWLESALIDTYPVTIDVTTVTGSQETTQSFHWLVTNYYAGGHVSAVFRKLYLDVELSYPPWVGVAMPLTLPEAAENQEDGHVFCFLPLPSEKQNPTGLPVHLNGFFALEQNRKYIKWPTHQQRRSDLMDKRLLWNQCLIKEALPCAYAQLLIHAITAHQSGSSLRLPVDVIYHAFPSFERVDKRWEPILVPLYAEILKHDVVYTAARGGCWLSPRDAIFDTLEEDGVTRDVVLRVLAHSDVRVAHVPPHVLHAIKACCNINMGRISPNLVAQAFRDVQGRTDFSWNDKIALLSYLAQQQKYDVLDGLALLPLASGTFATFSTNPRRADRDIFIANSEHQLHILPSVTDDLLEPNLNPAVKKYLIKGANKGYTQLKILTKELVAELLPKNLPPSWLDAQSVAWLPGSQGQPPLDWLEHLWTYLQKNYPKDLSVFDSMPLLPASRIDQSPVTLLQLYAAHGVLLREQDGMNLEEDIEGILRKLGVVILDEIPLFVRNHPLVSELYVHGPSYVGVLKVMFRMSQRLGIDTFTQNIRETTTDNEKRLLRSFFARMSAFELQFRPEFRQVLHRMPLLETVSGSGSQHAHFVSAHEVALAAPPDLLPVPLSQKMIDTTAPDSASLAALLRIRRLSQIEMFREIVFPDVEGAFYSPEEVEALMLYVLHHYHVFMKQDPSFSDTLRQLPFMMRRGTFLTTDRFYIPDNELLQKLFLGENNFPSGPYAEPTIIAILKELGLREPEDMEPEDLLETAQQIQDSTLQPGYSAREAETKSQALMEYLRRVPSKLQELADGEKLHLHLARIKWVTALAERPSFYPDNLPWYKCEERFQRPSDIKDIMYASIVGSSMAVISDSHDGELGQIFGWSTPPSLDRIIAQLKQIVVRYEAGQKAKFMNLADRIYNELMRHPTSDVVHMLEREKITDWIWHGEGFASTDTATFRPSFMDLRPFVHSLPKEVEQYNEFFKQCGVKEMCHLPQVLRNIQRKYCDTRTQHSSVEVKRDMHICVSILNELKSSVSEEDMKALQSDLVIPVHIANERILKMAPLEDCTFCDEEWLRQGYDMRDLADGDEQILYVHPNVPISTAEALGVPTLMSRMLNAEELDFSFGQSDSLTHRLNVLLQDYTDGFAVPKEVIQNADDAGATEVKFLYDERENNDAKSCLIDDGMKECQGPALWAYNDGVFSDEDFENITKLSGATKEMKTDMIGSFGLGFNAVYNLTDVPSFISRHNIVIFDPHTTHLGKSIRNKSKPGIKIDMRKHKRKMKRLGNQFKPFNGIFGCDLRPDTLQESFPGTLFRFPLRTKVQAVKSEISQKHYDDNEVKSLLQMLAKGAPSLLLFTQHVNKVSVWHIPKSKQGQGQPVEVLSVIKVPVQRLRELNYQGPIPESVQSKSKEFQGFVRQNKILRASKDALCQLRSGKKIDDRDMPCSSSVVSIETRYMGPGEKLLGVKASSTRQLWLMTSAFGTNRALKMALPTDHLCPVGGVAVPLNFNQNEVAKYIPTAITDSEGQGIHQGQVFCYLPLPVYSGLPVHINGSFAVTSSRRQLCEPNEDDKYDMRSQWNEALLEDCVCKAYIIMLEDLSRIAPATAFATLWPRANVETSVRSLRNSFYSLILHLHNSKILSDEQLWIAPPQAIFLDPALRQSKIGNIIVPIFRQCLTNEANKLVDLPLFALECFSTCGQQPVVLQKSFTLEQFLKDYLMPNLNAVDENARDEILLYALETEHAGALDIIKETRCIPCTPAGKYLRKPSELIDPSSDIAGMFHAKDNRFPLGRYATRLVLNTLASLGMCRLDIMWNDVIDRVGTLVQMDDARDVRHRLQCVLTYLERKLSRIEDETASGDTTPQNETAGNTGPFYREHLQNAAFLPVMQRPSNHNIFWKGDAYTTDAMLPPCEMFPVEMQALVCCVKPIADESVFPKDCTRIKEYLGLQRLDPSIETVLLQLDTLLQLKLDREDKVMLANVNDITQTVYEYLQSQCTSEGPSRDTILNELQGKPCIYIGGKFLKPTQLAFNFQGSCSPYLYPVPEAMARQFRELLQLLGVHESFSLSDYASVLTKMHNKFGEAKLEQKELRLALRLTNLLNESMTEMGHTLDDVVNVCGTIHIPDADGTLRSSSELCFNEPHTQWLPGSENIRLSHRSIPYTISQQLGVNTRRQEVIKKHSMGIAFGQKESLTNRIRRILASYPCDKEIMKELLQNADDAAASDIHFVKDPREHSKVRVFDDSWKPLQGPSLCVYNNRAFTEKDLAGIQRLGEGSKTTDPNKTGQYGVGFNCVYHLTDAPSFLTCGAEVGQTLCVFDPHACYTPGATPAEPGRRFNNVSELKNIFTDVFTCYMDDKFNLNEGTMFRFPLRTGEMLATSELSDEVFPIEKLEQLLSRFKSEVFDCLLFLNNIRSISISEVNPVTKRITNTYTANIEMSDEARAERQVFADYLKIVVSALRSGDMKVWDIPSREVSYNVKLTDNKGTWEKWLVVQRIGFEDTTSIPESIHDAFRKGDLSLLPRGGVAALIDASDPEAFTKHKKAYCFLPLPVKTSLPVHINGHFALDHEARRNLWIDEDSGYKTDWNLLLLKQVIGNAYVTMLKRIPPYLKGLEVDHSNASFSILDEKQTYMEIYSRLFPKHDTHVYWLALSQSVYQLIHMNQETVLPILKIDHTTLRPRSIDSLNDSSDGTTIDIDWVSTKGNEKGKPYFDNLDETYLDEADTMSGTLSRDHRLKSTPKKVSRRDIMRRVLLRTGFKLLCLPSVIQSYFAEADVDLNNISSEALVNFYKTYGAKKQCCKVCELPAHIANTQFQSESSLISVLEYCMQDREYFLDHLDGLPLCLGEDDQLRVFDMHNAHFLSPYYGLLPDCGFMFLHHSLAEGVFRELDPDRHNVFQRLDILALSRLMANVMPHERYHKISDHVLWSKESTTPSVRWVKILWAFLRDECNRLSENELMDEKLLVTKLREYLSPLEKWCILPAFVAGPTKAPNKRQSMLDSMDTDAAEQYLVPLNMTDTVIDFTHASIMNNHARDSLRALGVHEINSKLLDSSGRNTPLAKSSLFSSFLDLSKADESLLCNSDLARQLVANLESPKSVLRMLEFCFKSKPSNFQLTKEDSFHILKYFNDSLEQWIDDPAAVACLKDLPVFYTINNVPMVLDGNFAYVLPTDIPPAEMYIWEQQEGTIFLQRSKALSSLHNSLGCKELSISDVYNRFIFPNFSLLTHDAQIVHLVFLRDTKLKQSSESEAHDILTGLCNLAFMRDSEGVLRTANFFYDPHHPVFKSMLGNNPSAFPPDPFSGFKWLDLLRKIGLQHTVTSDMLIDYAQLIAEESRRGPSDETFNCSRTLVAHIFKRENLPTEGFLEQIRDIPFIPPVKVRPMLQKMHPQFSELEKSEYSYVTFAGSMGENHEYLIWSAVHLLPDWANPYKLTQGDVSYDYPETHPLHQLDAYKSEIGALLCVEEDPDLEVVVNHVKNVCCDENVYDTLDSDLKAYMKVDVMKVVYKYLQAKLVGNEEAGDELRDVPCLLVDKGCTMVKPRQVVINLFEEDQIIPFLYKAPTELGEFKRLFTFLGASLGVSVEQYATVLELMYHATKGEKMHPNEMKAAFKAVYGLFTSLEKLDSEVEIQSEALYLPTKSGTIQHNKTVVFNDDQSYTDRITYFDRSFLVDLDECGIQSTYHEGLVRRLPEHLQPVMLTSLVHEALEDKKRCTIVEHGVAEKLRNQANSRAFAGGVMRLVKHESHRWGKKINKNSLQPIRDQLKRIYVYAVEKVVTYLVYNRERMSGSEIESECFVEKVNVGNRDEQWNIYIDNVGVLSEEVLVSVAEVINRIIGGLLRNSVHYLQPILNCPPHLISKVLDRLKIKPDHSVDFKEPTLPKPGDFIPTEDHHLLQDQMCSFEKGEYIGYELEDDDNKGPTFIYGIIIEKIPMEAEHTLSHFNQRYKISIGEDRKPITALLPDLYTFHRVEGFVTRSASAFDFHAEDSFHTPAGTPQMESPSGFRRTFSDDNLGRSRENLRSSKENINASRESFKGSNDNLKGSRTPTSRRRGNGNVNPEIQPESSTPESGFKRRFGNRNWGSFSEGFTNKQKISEEEEEQPEDGPDGGRSGATGSKFSRTSQDRHSFTSRSRKKFWWQDDKYDPNKRGQAEEDVHEAHGVPQSDERFQAQDTGAGYHNPSANTGGSSSSDRHRYARGEEQAHEQQPQYEQQHEPQHGAEPEHGQQYQQAEQAAPSAEPEQILYDGKTAQEVANEVSDQLEEGWSLDEKQRKKVIKRLLLKWHPDKNWGQEKFATQVTQHIHAEVERLEQGLPRPGVFEQFEFDERNPFAESTTFKQNFTSAYKFFMDQMNERAKEHKRQRERYKENFSREYRTSDNPSGFNFDVPPTFSSANPQPQHAKRFLEQAQEDLRAADNDFHAVVPAFEWVCFKAHQAAEKALKAAQFSVDAVTSFSHDLIHLAATIEDVELRRLAMKLQNIIGNANKFYNPDPIDFVVIPHDEFTSVKGGEAMRCARDILDKVTHFMELTDDKQGPFL